MIRLTLLVLASLVFGGGVRAGEPLSGIATWYDAPTPRDAAAGPALRTGDWRGRTVTVTYKGRSVTVRLTDWCACRGRLIDLDDVAFSRLAPLSRGVIRVTVSGAVDIPLPATDALEKP